MMLVVKQKENYSKIEKIGNLLVQQLEKMQEKSFLRKILNQFVVFVVINIMLMWLILKLYLNLMMIHR